MPRLGDICRFQSGGTPSKSNAAYFGGSIPWVSSVALNGAFIDAEDAVTWITEKAIKESAAKIIPTQSILVGIRVGVGKTAINNVPMSACQDVVALLDIDETQWDKKFLCKFLLSQNAYLKSQSRGATIKGIKIETLANLKLPQIDLQQQRQIANTIDVITGIIAKHQLQLSKLEALVKSQFVEMFGDILNNGKQWPVELLGEVAQIGSSKRIFAKEYVSSGIPFYRGKEIVELSSDQKPSVELYISRERYSEIKEKFGIPQKGDILMTAVGTIGKFWVVDTNMPFYYKDGNVVYIRAPKFNPIFFRKQLEMLIEDYKTKNASGSAYSALPIEKLKNMSVVLPPFKQQEFYCKFVERVDKSKFAA